MERQRCTHLYTCWRSTDRPTKKKERGGERSNVLLLRGSAGSASGVGSDRAVNDYSTCTCTQHYVCERRTTVEHEHVRHVCVLPCDEAALPGFGDVVEAGCKVRMQAGFILMKATADCRVSDRAYLLLVCLYCARTIIEVVVGSSKMNFGEVCIAYLHSPSLFY